MDATDAGMVISLRDVQLKKAASSMVVSWLLFAKVTLARLVQPLNALRPRVVTPLGMVMPVSEVQKAKAASPMVVTLSGMITPVIELHH